MTRTRTAGLALLLTALLLAGCGGGGGGEPTVTQTVHDELQAELDAALAALAQEREAKAQEKTARDAAEAEVARLTGDLGTAAAQAATLESSLATATAEVTRLEGVIGAETDSADADGSLHAQLNAATAEVTRLEGMIGDADDTADADGSLHAQLNAAKAEVTELTNKIGSAADAESLEGMLAVAKTRVTELETLIGDRVNPAAGSLYDQLATANDKVRELEAQIGTAADATSLQGKLTAAEAEVTQLKSQLATEKAEVARLTTALAVAEANAAQQAQQAQQQVSSREANQRAQNLKTAFSSVITTTDLTEIGLSDAVPTRGTLRVTRGGHSPVTLPGSGIRSREMRLISGADDGKTVVYTDRELTRTLLEHFGQQRDSDDNTRFDLEGPIVLGTSGNILHVSTPKVDTQWRISHSLPTSPTEDQRDRLIDSNHANYDPPDPRTSYAGHLYGLSGSFICDDVDNCRVRVTPMYATTADDNDRYPLLSVNVESVVPDAGGGFTTTGGGTLYFKPSSGARIPLYTGGPVGPDGQYMTFGYWREDPTSAAADYKVGVFAEAFPEAGALTDVTATYDGTAAGMYVEQDPNDPVDTHRQGEFTADVSLKVDDGTLSGDIDDFVTTPTGGSAQPRTADRWVVRLRSAAMTGDGFLANTTAYIDNLSGVKSGTWSNFPVAAHANAADATGMADTTPPAITGTFNTHIVDFVHILGAYGAHKR